MALGRQRERQSDILVSWAELPRSPVHAFYDKLQSVLIASDFDRFVEMQCASEYAPRHGRPSLPPGRYFRMLLVGYFEGIDSERVPGNKGASAGSGGVGNGCTTFSGSSRAIE